MPHLIFSSDTQRAKLFADDGQQKASWEMHDAAVNPGFGRWGRCPRGVYTLGDPRPEDTPPFGWWFIPVLGVPNRVGIGIHGGGSGLVNPLAAEQSPPWIWTHGCLRMRNCDLGMQTPEPGTLVHYRQTISGVWKLTVEGP
jgi:hypothetical protein